MEEIKEIEREGGKERKSRNLFIIINKRYLFSSGNGKGAGRILIPVNVINTICAIIIPKNKRINMHTLY